MRPGIRNLFAAPNVTTGEVLGECKPNRNGATFLAFMKKDVKPHAGKEIRLVLGSLSALAAHDVKAWQVKNPHVHFHFTPVGFSWVNQIEIWFGFITRQSIRRGTFASVDVPGRSDPRLHQLSEREREVLHLDRHHRRDPRR